MNTVSLHNKDKIYQHLKSDVHLHLYSIGDLDDFYWPSTQWYALRDGDQIKEIALLYFGHSMPTLLALTTNTAQMQILLENIRDLLPTTYYAHLSPGLDQVFAPEHRLEDHGKHYKMALRDLQDLPETRDPRLKRIQGSELESVNNFYQKSYPQNWFDPRMLDTGQYFGLFAGETLLSIAGVHVYSPRYQVAALGNIATHPDHRDRGYATTATAHLCQSLSQNVKHIGLNVKADNGAALRCYHKLGFEIVAPYRECTIHKT